MGALQRDFGLVRAGRGGRAVASGMRGGWGWAGFSGAEPRSTGPPLASGRQLPRTPRRAGLCPADAPAPVPAGQSPALRESVGACHERRVEPGSARLMHLHQVPAGQSPALREPVGACHTHRVEPGSARLMRLHRFQRGRAPLYGAVVARHTAGKPAPPGHQAPWGDRPSRGRACRRCGGRRRHALARGSIPERMAGATDWRGGSGVQQVEPVQRGPALRPDVRSRRGRHPPRLRPFRRTRTAGLARTPRVRRPPRRAGSAAWPRSPADHRRFGGGPGRWY